MHLCCSEAKSGYAVATGEALAHLQKRAKNLIGHRSTEHRSVSDQRLACGGTGDCLAPENKTGMASAMTC